MKNLTQHNTFFTSAIIISLGGLLSKLLGAIYRIPLTNLLGSYGMGLYQLVFPPYILVMTLATAGIPVAVSKMVAERNQLGNIGESKKVFNFALVVLLCLGLIGSIAMFALAEPLARWQGNLNIASAYRIIAPSIVCITLTSAFRGFYQGNMNMLPVAVSQVSEQVAKLIIGLICAVRFMPDVNKAVQGAVFAVTASEFVSLSIVLLCYGFKNNRLPLSASYSDDNSYKKQIFLLALPVVIGGFIMQMAQLLDSVMVVNLVTADNPTNLYGLWTGPVNSLLGLPVSLASGVAISALPSITRTYTQGDRSRLTEKYNSAIKMTLVIALPSAFGIMAMAKPVLGMLYGALPAEEIEIASKLLSLSALSIVFLSILQTLIATLQALGKPYVPVLILIVGVAVKFLTNLILLPIDSINIYGSAISETLCFLFATVSGIIYLFIKQGLSLRFDEIIRVLACNVVMVLALLLFVFGASEYIMTFAGTMVAIILCAILYLAMVVQLRVFTPDELGKILKRRSKNVGELQ